MAVDSISGLSSGVDYTTLLNTATQGADEESFKTALETAQSSEDEEEIKAVCKQFEAVFINMLLKQMRQTIQDGGLTEKSQARETFEGMLDEQMATEMSDSGGIGIADLMAKALTRSNYTETSDEASTSTSIDDSIMNLLGDSTANE